VSGGDAAAPRRTTVADLSVPAGLEVWLAQLEDLSWLHVAGRDPARLRIVATLLHGNEPSGIRALHRWLRLGVEPATDLWLLIGAVRAALEPPVFAHRFLAAHGDLNRCWTSAPSDPRTRRVAELARALSRSNAELLIDMHNNTGHNPVYGVGPRRDAVVLAVVSLFGRRFVHSSLALGTLVEAMAPHFPSVTIECGRAGDPGADAAAFYGLSRVLALDSLTPLDAAYEDMQLLGDPIRVTLRAGTRLRFDRAPDAAADLTLDPDLDRHNFELLDAGAPLGWLRGDALPLCAHDASGVDRAHDLFASHEGRLAAARPWIPVMVTTDPIAARIDCLFYVVQPLAR